MERKTKLLTTALAAACLFGTTVGALGFETSRRAMHNMLVTRSATPAPQGQAELRLGLDYTRHIGARMFDNNWGKTDREKMRLWDWSVQVAYGLTDDMDVFVSTGWFDIKDREQMEGLDRYGRGLKDLSVGVTKQFQTPMDHVTVAYIPELFVPIGRDAKFDGRIGLGRDFWELNQTLAVTVESDPILLNTNLSHSIPFGRTRRNYATPFMTARRDVRGITELKAEALYMLHEMVQPMANLSYAHHWISGGSDSDLITAGIGARIQLTEQTQLMMGYDYPMAGRNSLRTQNWRGGLVQEF